MGCLMSDTQMSLLRYNFLYSSTAFFSQRMPSFYTNKDKIYRYICHLMSALYSFFRKTYFGFLCKKVFDEEISLIIKIKKRQLPVFNPLFIKFESSSQKLLNYICSLILTCLMIIQTAINLLPGSWIVLEKYISDMYSTYQQG